MVLKVYSIYDQKTGVYDRPFLQHTHGEAERNFKQLVNDEKSQVNKFPEDYDLYYLGEYDNNTGKYQTLDSPQHLIKAVQLKEQHLALQ